MKTPENLIVVCAGADAVRAEERGLPRLLLCLGLGARGLRRLTLPARTEGCYLGLCDLGLTGDPSPAVADAVVTEAQRMKAAGVLADFERVSPGVHTLLRGLDRACAGEGLPLFVPLAQADSVSHAFLIAETAISGGSLEGWFRELLSRYPGRIAASLRPVSADFTLPTSDSEGAPLTADERSALQRRVGAQSFFSRELCARYFTYMERGEPHFVLFDDDATLTAKLHTLERLGVDYCFAPWPDVAGLLD